MMNFRRYMALCVEEALRGLWFYRKAVTPSLMVMTASLTVLGAFLLVSSNLGAILADWRGRGQLQVFLASEATDQQIDDVAAALRRNTAVQTFRFVSVDEAARLFRSDFDELGELLDMLEDNPLPASFSVTIIEDMRSERVLAELAEDWTGFEGVEGVQYDLQIIRRLELGVRAVRLIGLLLGGTVLMAAIITTINVIRVLVVSRGTEIHIMRLVGASERVVLGRFLFEGGLQGFMAGLAALGVLYAVYRVGLAYVGRGSLAFLTLLPIGFLDERVIAGVVLVGTLAGLFSTWLAFRRGGVLSPEA